MHFVSRSIAILSMNSNIILIKHIKNKCIKTNHNFGRLMGTLMLLVPWAIFKKIWAPIAIWASPGTLYEVPRETSSGY